MKKQILSTCLVLLLCISCVAQQSSTAKKYSATINKKHAYKHLSVLASDEYEGRETGKKGAWMAAEYIRNNFKSMGLTGPVQGEYFQTVDMSTYNLSQMALSINGKAKTFGEDFVLSSSTIPLGGFNVKASEIVFAGYGLNKNGYNDFEGIDVAGKIVFIFGYGDPTQKGVSTGTDRASRRKMIADQQAKLAYLSDQKAIAVIQVDPNLDNISEDLKEAYSPNGQLELNTAERIARLKNLKTLPSIRVSTATANELLQAANTTVAALKQQITTAVQPASQVIKIEVAAATQKEENKLRAENVLGFLEGSDPLLKEEVIVITAHYDHIGISPSGDDKINNGADDDGSGTTGVLLIADAFAKAKKAGKGPKRSILFMTVVGEEKGLLGSEWYSENPVFPLANTITNLNIDMIGRVDDAHLANPDYIYIIGSDMLSSDLNALGIKANDDYMKINLDMTYNNRTDPNQYYYRSDHYNFAKHGIPVIFYFNGVHEQYHKPGDEIDKINFDLLTRRTQLVYFTAWELANAAKRPVVDKNEDGTPKN